MIIPLVLVSIFNSLKDILPIVTLVQYIATSYFPDIDECATNTSGCSQTCNNTEGSFHCDCGEGYELSDDQRTCTDINECLTDAHDCQQLCVNTDGGFRCECNNGFQLNSDQNTCSGMSFKLLKLKYLISSVIRNNLLSPFIQTLMNAKLTVISVTRGVTTQKDHLSVAV